MFSLIIRILQSKSRAGLNSLVGRIWAVGHQLMITAT